MMRLTTRTAAIILVLTVPCLAARTSVPAQRAFADYIATLETRLSQQHVSPETYLVTFNLTPAERTNVERQLESGVVRVEPVNGGTWEVSGGLLHHWRG